jgi:UDP-N-acetyl-2-amino-2-deoxyglucuronate dehydrogenase
MSDKVGIGLVGLGMAGRTHVREIEHIDGASTVAVFGRTREKVEAFAEQFGVPNVYTDYGAFLADPDVDVVDVLLPHGSHRDYAVPAADAGKHVVVEKPLELDLNRAREIIDACDRNGVTLGVIYQMRFGVWARRVKAAVEAGELGELILVDGIEKAFRDPEYYARDPWRGTREMEGAGCLMTQSIHVIDLLQWIAGPVTSVNGIVRTARHDIEVPDLSVARLTYANGAPGMLESSTAISPALRSRVEVHGKNGSVIFNPEYDHLYYWSVEGVDEGPVESSLTFPFLDTPDPNEFPEERHRQALTDILEAIAEGRHPLVPGIEALKSLAIVLAIEESARTGCDTPVADVSSGG